MSIIRDLCQLSGFAYTDNKIIRDGQVNSLGYVVTDVFSDNEIDGIVCESDDAVVLAFRGSESITECIQDWITNFKINKKNTFIGDVHTGFFGGASAIYELIGSTLERGKQIYVTGHSQGGALASVFGAIYADYKSNNSIIVVTFAQPRVGGKKFTKRCKKIGLKLLRFENSSDIVAKLPLKTFMRYRDYQSGHLYFNRNGKLLTNPSLLTRKIDFWLDFAAKPLDVGLDHILAEYKKLIFKHFSK